MKDALKKMIDAFNVDALIKWIFISIVIVVLSALISFHVSTISRYGVGGAYPFPPHVIEQRSRE
jgi:hypothetical protein